MSIPLDPPTDEDEETESIDSEEDAGTPMNSDTEAIDTDDEEILDKRPIIGDTSITILPAAPSTVPAIFARNDFIFKIAGEEVFKTYRAEDGSSAGTVEPFTYIDNAKLYVTDMNWNIAFDLLMESPETAGVLYQIIADKLYVTCFELREEEILTFRFSWA